MSAHSKPSPGLWRERLWAVLALSVFVILRWFWVGHLLTWDEAATLCSVRSFVSRGTDYYSGWFWRRPPLYNLLLTQLHPLSPGFAERAQTLSLVVATMVALAMWYLNRSVFGRRVAGWSLAILAVLPGSVFYDTWIKQDGLAALFGLLAILLFVKRRWLYAGLALGLAFLAKELALFYAGVLFLLWWMDRTRVRFRELAAIYGVAAATAGWWFLLFSNSVKAVWRFLTDPGNMETQAWTRPWYYFFEKLPLDLDAWGVLLAIFGCLALWRAAHASGKKDAESRRADRCWPLTLLVPAYALISVMRAKTPWFTISLFPAWATLAAVGWDGLLQAWEGLEVSTLRRSTTWALVGMCSLGALGLRWGRNFEAELRAREWGLWWGSRTSRATAEKLNQLVEDDERVLITPMFYWTIAKKIPCVVFVCYLRPGIPVVVRDYNITAQEFVDTVREYRLHWAMVSPDPRDGTERLLIPLIRDYGLQPLWNRGACIFRTARLWENEPELRTDGEPFGGG